MLNVSCQMIQRIFNASHVERAQQILERAACTRVFCIFSSFDIIQTCFAPLVSNFGVNSAQPTLCENVDRLDTTFASRRMKDSLTLRVQPSITNFAFEELS